MQKEKRESLGEFEMGYVVFVGVIQGDVFVDSSGPRMEMLSCRDVLKLKLSQPPHTARPC
jgi:hypothetical protein